jgi:hypothetical protein
MVAQLTEFAGAKAVLNSTLARTTLFTRKRFGITSAVGRIVYSWGLVSRADWAKRGSAISFLTLAGITLSFSFFCCLRIMLRSSHFGRSQCSLF